MACRNVLETFKQYKEARLSEGFSQRAIDSKWAEALLAKRTGSRRDAIAKVLSGIDESRDRIDVAVKFNGGTPKEQRLLDIAEEGNGYRVFLDNGSYFFPKDSKKSEKTAKGMYIELPVMEVLTSRQLGSTLGDNQQYGDFEAQATNLLQNPEKAVELLEEIDALDSVKTTKAHKEHLIEMLTIFTKSKFIPNTVVELNKKAEQNGGSIRLDFGAKEAKIKLSVGRNVKTAANEQSAIEKYVHEVAHAFSEFALNANDPDIADATRRLRRFREDVRSSLSKEEFITTLMPTNSIDRVREAKIAEDMYNYMFENSDSGISEFLVHSVTNDAMIKKLKDIKINHKDRNKYKDFNNFFEYAVAKLKELMDSVFRTSRGENFDTSGNDLAVKLIMEISKANNKVVRRQGAFTKVSNFLNKMEQPLIDKIDKIVGNIENEEIPKRPTSGGKVAEAKWVAKMVQHMLYDSKGRPVAERVLSAVGAKPEGTVQTYINKFRDSDTLDTIVEKLGLESQKIDQKREVTANVTEVAIMDAFKKTPSHEEMNVMTSVGLETDLSAIYATISKSKLKEIMQDGEKLREETEKLEDELKSLAKDERTFNYYKAQSEGLGYYLATHSANITQLLNANNIAKGLNRVEKTEDVSQEVVTLIDKISTMYSLKHTEASQKEIFIRLLDKEPKAIDNFMAIHQSFKEESEKKLFNQSEFLRIKGYTKEVFNEDVTIEIAPIDNYAEMKKAGFTLSERLVKSPGDTSTEEMGMYTSRGHLTQSYNRDVLRLTDWNRRGTTLTESRTIGNERLAKRKAEVDIKRLNLQAEKLVRKQEIGGYEFNGTNTVSDGLTPVINEYGNAIDFRYMMGKAKKRSLLDQDTRGPLVLARMHAGIVDKVETKEHNQEVIKAIFTDMEENYRKGSILGKKNAKEYIVISPDSPKKDIRELWKVLPSEVKAAFKEKGDRGVAVRRDMLYSYFGFRDMSLANSMPAQHLPTYARNVIRVAEDLWKEVVKVSKVDIVIRTPMVLVGNIMSNFIYSVQNGENPAEVAKLQIRAVRDLREYIDMNRELIKLRMAKQTGNPLGLDVNKITSLEENLKSSPVSELIDAGMYQAIIEDIGLNEFKETNKLTKKVNEKLDKFKAPQFIKNGLEMAYITDKTKVFKTLTTATQFSDFAARYAQFHLLKRRGVANDVALKSVLDAFVNYNGNDKTSKYLNDIGLLMFTKYFQRIQRVVRQTGSKHPLHLLLAILGQEFVVGDLDEISDQSMFTKDLSNAVYSPLDHVMRAITPTSLEWAGIVN